MRNKTQRSVFIIVFFPEEVMLMDVFSSILNHPLLIPVQGRELLLKLISAASRFPEKQTLMTTKGKKRLRGDSEKQNVFCFSEPLKQKMRVTGASQTTKMI